MKETLYDKLLQWETKGNYPFHMPGHKRNLEKLPQWNPYAMDITEIDGFDNLHDAEEILADTMKEIAEFRSAEESFMLINGSSCGLLAGISACVSHRSEILVARNCHKAVYHGIYLNELTPHYIYPQFSYSLGINGGILQKNIEKMLISHPKTQLVVLTSPTYEGIVSNIQKIVETCHKYKVPVLVDQAHGAHFSMGEKFPVSAVEMGADLVVESVHKTLPAFTQTALLHVQGDLVDRKKLRKYLGIYQTSSPSYPLMAGIAWCMDECKRQGKQGFAHYEERVLRLRRRIAKLEMITLFDGADEDETFGQYDYDFGKLVFGVKDQIYSGQWLYDRLRNSYHLQMEMASMKYVIAMTSIMDTEEGFQRLFHALEDIDQMARSKQKQENCLNCVNNSKNRNVSVKQNTLENRLAFTPYEVEEKEGKRVQFIDSKGEIAKDFVYLYPPGIPLLVPGEEISQELIAYVMECEKEGLAVKGLKENTIEVVG